MSAEWLRKNKGTDGKEIREAGAGDLAAASRSFICWKTVSVPSMI